MYIIRQLLFLLLLALANASVAQDTAFVRSLPLDSAVQNISTNGHDLYIRFNKSICSWKQNELEFVTPGKLKYSKANYDRDSRSTFFNHSLYLESGPADKIASWSAILPGNANHNTTEARIGNQLFISNNGIVLEYKVNPYIKKYHPGKSIRHVFTESGFRFISTYSGLFTDTVFNVFNDVPITGRRAGYSNGEFVRIDSMYLLCQDDLLLFNKDDENFEVLIQTEEKARFRKLVKFNNSVYGLFNKAFAEVDLSHRKILPYIITDDLTDCIIYDGKLFVSSMGTTLYEVSNNEVIKKYKFPYNINDLSIINGKLHVGTSNGLFAFTNGDPVTVLPSFEVVQSTQINDKIVISNNSGLYIYHDDQVITVVDGVEFNKMALNKDVNYLYAGSVDGLYVIKHRDINELVTFTVKSTNEENSSVYYMILVAVIATMGFLIFGFALYRKKHLHVSDQPTKTVYSSQIIRQAMAANPNIISAEMLAEYFNTSVVQINRHLKKENTTSLKVMKEFKRETAIEMRNAGKSIEDIAKRTGYAPRYIKENFLKGQM